MAHVMSRWTSEAEVAALMECCRLEEGEFGVGEEGRRRGEGGLVEAGEADDELARFDAVDGRADGVAEQREALAQLDRRETLRGEEPERVEVLAHVAGRLDHPEVQRARRQAQAGLVAGECVLEVQAEA